ncbi:MAG: outer membrane beta-barrel protein [Bacteroidota bacterium]
MKKLSLLLVALFGISFIGIGQIRFEPGYYIDNEGVKSTCLIKNVGWSNNPEKFTYLISENGEVQFKDLTEVQEFGIINDVRFRRFIVEMDQSTNRLNALSKSPNPEYVVDTLFLKELVSGDASLFSYKNGDINRYFYTTPDLDITQLVYKKYKKNGSVATNKQYLTQLFLDVNCKKDPANKIEKVKYVQTDLVAYFIEENKCRNSDYFSVYETKPSSETDTNLHLNLRAGVSIASLVVDYLPGRTFDADFGTQIIPRVGLEMEVAFPGTRNKWAFILEPYYTSYQEEIILPNSPQTTTDEAMVNFTTVEISAGVRYYVFLNNKSRLFANLGMTFGITGNSNITIERVADFPTTSGLRGNIGIGYNYNDRLSLELRQNSPYSLINRVIEWDSQYNSMALVLGVRLF